MIDHLLSEDQIMIRDAAAKFAQEQLQPVASLVETPDERPTFLANLKDLSELGFMGLSINERYGGVSVDSVGFSLVITELAKACASSAVTTSVTNMVAEVIQSVGNEAQCERYLPRLCSGDYRAASFCLSEAGAGSDPSGMATSAVQSGNDWVINGSKLWISSAPYAGLFVVWAVTEPNAPKGKGITCFLVEADNEGISIQLEEKKMGQCASATCAIHFEDCRVSQESVLGEVNNGFRIAVSELAGGRIGIASLALGIGFAAMDYATEYASERKQFDMSIASMQGPSWMIADAYTDLCAAQLLTWNAARLKQAGAHFSKEASMAKLYASEKANQVCYSAIQLMGGLGFTKDVPLERYARDVRVTSIYEGTSEIQRVIIAREILNSL